MIFWPTTLPQYLEADSYSSERGATFIESSMELGPAKRRRTTTRAINSFNGEMIMTPDQFDILLDFIDVTTNGGVLPFQFPNQLKQGTYLKVRFKLPMPKEKPLGNVQLKVSMSFEEVF